MATLAHTHWQIENVRQTNENHKSLPRNLFRIREYFSHLNFYGKKGAFYVFILNQQSVERKFAFSDRFKAGWVKGRCEQKKGLADPIESLFSLAIEICIVVKSDFYRFTSIQRLLQAILVYWSVVRSDFCLPA